MSESENRSSINLTMLIGSTSAIFGTAFVIMFVLKIYELIDISWWWITAPIWIPAMIISALGVTVLLIYIIGLVCFKLKKRKWK